ncbi:MAG: Fe-Mn family superoxide dismutase [Alphaproteobacteria bacterium]
MVLTLNRRRFLHAAGATAIAVQAAEGTTALAQAPAKPPSYAVKPLPFDPQTIKGLSEKLLLSHHENNYTGAVKRLNAIAEQLAALDFAKAPGFTINGLKREELIATNSMILHELYFDGLAGNGEITPSMREALARDFGSVERWQAEFNAMGKALGGGSGWVLLTYSAHDKRLVNQWAPDHTVSLAAGQPILALDMFEHAYQMDYGAKAGAYVDAVMANFKWSNAERLYKAAVQRG